MIDFTPSILQTCMYNNMPPLSHSKDILRFKGWEKCNRFNNSFIHLGKWLSILHKVSWYCIYYPLPSLKILSFYWNRTVSSNKLIWLQIHNYKEILLGLNVGFCVGTDQTPLLNTKVLDNERDSKDLQIKSVTNGFPFLCSYFVQCVKICIRCQLCTKLCHCIGNLLHKDARGSMAVAILICFSYCKYVLVI